MSAVVKCNCCGRIATARIVEDSPEINALVVEPEWANEDVEWEFTSIDGKPYWFMKDDVECRLFTGFCEHEDYEIIEVNYDDYYD